MVRDCVLSEPSLAAFRALSRFKAMPVAPMLVLPNKLLRMIFRYLTLGVRQNWRFRRARCCC